MELVVIEEKIKNIETAIEKNNKKIEELDKIYISVEKLAMEIKSLREETNNVNCRLKKIEEEPADKWKSMCSTVIGISISAVITFILCKLGLK